MGRLSPVPLVPGAAGAYEAASDDNEDCPASLIGSELVFEVVTPEREDEAAPHRARNNRCPPRRG
jgi:hypothetical protein